MKIQEYYLQDQPKWKIFLIKIFGKKVGAGYHKGQYLWRCYANPPHGDKGYFAYDFLGKRYNLN